MLSDSAIDRYRRDGFVVVDPCLRMEEVTLLREEVERLAGIDAPGRVLERDGRTVRALHGCHLDSDVMMRLTRLPRLVGAAMTLLGGDVYVYQFKINMKAAFTGDVWQWHQDFIYWRSEDGMPACEAINLALHLDEAHETNGSLMLIPGSHRHGVVEPVRHRGGGDGSWRDNVSADLRYTLAHEDVTRLTQGAAIKAIHAPAGSLLLFHPNVAHASLPNLSPDPRRMAIVTYNRVTNAPPHPRRPPFLVGRDTRPIVPLAEDRLDVGMATGRGAAESPVREQPHALNEGVAVNQ